MPENAGQQVVNGFLITLGLFLAIVPGLMGVVGVLFDPGHRIVGIGYLLCPFLGWFFARLFSPALARGLLLGGCIALLLMGMFGLLVLTG